MDKLLGKRVERTLKRRIFGLLARRPSEDARREVDLRRVGRVLLVRTNVRLGNLLLITPAITALRCALPQARIDVLCDAVYGSLLSADPAVDHVIRIDRRIMRDPLALARLVRQLRGPRYDLVVECARGGSFLGAVFTALAGGRFRVCSTGGRYGRFFNVHVPRGSRTHKVDFLLDLLAGIGVPAPDAELRVVLTAAEQAEAARAWASWGVEPEAVVIGVNLGGRGHKRWPSERFVELTRRLHALGLGRLALFAGPEEQATLSRIRARLPDEMVVVPLLPVRAFAAVLARCTLLVTTDTGPMHLAAAVGTATVVITRSASSAAYAPRGETHRRVHAADGPSVERVLAAVGDALRARDVSASSSLVARWQ